MRLFFILFFIHFSSLIFSQEIVINEFMSSNTHTISDPDGDFSDWIELYNATEDEINLSAYGISDDEQRPFKWIFPPVIVPPKSFVLVFASNKNIQSLTNLHTNFKLDSSGEYIVLTKPNGDTEDIIEPISLGKDVSYGRGIDGSAGFERMYTSTPNTSNSFSNSLIFSHESGFYSSDINLSVYSTNGDDIFYTTDGSEPTANSTLYSTPLQLSSLLQTPDYLSNISEVSSYYISPDEDNFKANIIKAASFNNGNISSRVYFKTVFVSLDTNNRYHDFELVSLVTPAPSLLDYDTGIYVKGVHYSNGNWNSGNFFMKGIEWERMAYIQYFNKQGKQQFEQEIGIRIHGGKTRGWPQKSLRLYSRHDYGAPNFNYPFFDHTSRRIFNRIVLRTSIGGWTKTIIKNACTSDICRDLKFNTVETKPVIVFLNGEYWGIYTLSEYFNASYFKNVYDLNEDSINIVIHGSGNRPNLPEDWGTVEGSNQGHIQMYDFLNNNDLSIESNYEYMKTILDIDNIIEYYCTEIYFNNKDWPTNNNKLWNYGANGKWKQLFYDIDGGWSYLGNDFNALQRVLSDDGNAQAAPYATFLFRKLTESEEFIAAFTKRMACLMKNEFQSDKVINSINAYKQLYSSGVNEQINRFHFNSAESYYEWEDKINDMISFANSRQAYVINHISSEFNISFNIDDYNCNEASNTIFVESNHLNLQVIVYPNPTINNSIWIDYNFFAVKVKYRIYSLSGKLMQYGEASNHTKINLNYPPGLYILKINSVNKQFINKIIIE